MRYRLVGTVESKRISVLLNEGRSTVGSESGVTVRLQDATVSRRHAEILVDAERIEVRDLDSKNGTFIGTHRISTRRIYPGTTVSFGRIALTLEAVDQQDLELGVRFLDSRGSSGVLTSGSFGHSTVGLRPVEVFAAEFLNQLLTLAEEGRGEAALVQAGGNALFSSLPALRVQVTARLEPDTVAFSATKEDVRAEGAVALEAASEHFQLRVELPEPKMAELFQPVVDCVAAILRLSAQHPSERAAGTGSSMPGTRQERLAVALPAPASVVPSMRRIYEEAARVASGTVGALICGESGTGKEVLARFLHAASQRAEAAFVALNCAALPNDLLEAELFGIERGVATGVDQRPGKFEAAHGGTLFLDEIGDMALSIQAKILRVLQEGEVFRLGGTRAHAADCRIIAATNRDMDELLGSGAFREDLYYRIATWVVELPALRHRRADIPNLAAHFLLEEARKRGVAVRGITTGALEVLNGYRWPGNIRQLRNEIMRAALFLGDGQALEASHLSPEILANRGAPSQGALEERLASYERLEILRAFQRCNGVATAAAEELGIGRSTLYRRMKALGIDQQNDQAD